MILFALYLFGLLAWIFALLCLYIDAYSSGDTDGLGILFVVAPAYPVILVVFVVVLLLERFRNEDSIS